MNHFPLCLDLTGKRVFLIGSGDQIREKAEKMAPFGAELIQKDTFTQSDADTLPALVIVGDTPLQQAQDISLLCRQNRIPVNVVDVPRLCSFYFPGLITRGSLTVAVSTGGTSPGAAAWLRNKLEGEIPDNTGPVLDWLGENRQQLKARGILKQAAGEALEKNRPLTGEELSLLEARL